MFKAVFRCEFDSRKSSHPSLGSKDVGNYGSMQCNNPTQSEESSYIRLMLHDISWVASASISVLVATVLKSKRKTVMSNVGVEIMIIPFNVSSQYRNSHIQL